MALDFGWRSGSPLRSLPCFYTVIGKLTLLHEREGHDFIRAVRSLKMCPRFSACGVPFATSTTFRCLCLPAGSAEETSEPDEFSPRISYCLGFGAAFGAFVGVVLAAPAGFKPLADTTLHFAGLLNSAGSGGFKLTS